MSGAHLVTMSAPNMVRIEIHVPDASGVERVWVEDTAEQAIGTAWCVLDSARRALEKAGLPVPLDLQTALVALAGRGDS